jgi:LysR family transcriptional regulator, glycine cleavage system transcriptional activator
MCLRRVVLFHRKDRGAVRLVPTEQAASVAVDVRTGLTLIERSMQRLRAPSGASLVITASQAFFGKWLMPRLDAFMAAHPAIHVRLDVSDRLVDVGACEADVAIRCGDGDWPDLHVEPFMTEEVFPVCAKSLLKKASSRPTFANLRQVTLIHDHLQSHSGGFPTWKIWLKQAGLTSLLATKKLDINSSIASIQAAIAGQGIALARASLVRADLESGLLVRLLPRVSHPAKWSYYLVRRKGEASPAVHAFCEWLTALS